MKKILTILAAIAVAGVPFLHAAPGGSVPPGVTHDQLAKKLRMAQQKDPIVESGPAAGNTDVDPSVENIPRNFIENSTIVNFRNDMTFIPKRSVIHIPDNYQNRLGIIKGAKVQKWADFYQANRGWIKTVEVSLEQARGNVSLTEATLKALEESTCMVVATFRGGPISIFPYVEKTEEEDKTSTPLAIQ